MDLILESWFDSDLVGASPVVVPLVTGIVITGLAPTKVFGRIVTPGVGNITLTGKAPTVIGMFPYVRSFSTSNEPATVTDHHVVLPATVVVADLLLIIFSKDVLIDDLPTPAGWTRIYNAGISPSRTYVYYKRATGTEGGTTVTIGTGVSPAKSAHLSYAIGNATTNGVEASASATGTGTSPDPASLTTSYGSASHMWMAFVGYQDPVIPNSFPSGYIDGHHHSPNGTAFDPSVAAAYKFTAAATEDAGAFTLATSEKWAAGTVAIKKAPPNVSYTIVPGVGNIVLSGKQPNNISHTRIPGVGNITLTGKIPLLGKYPKVRSFQVSQTNNSVTHNVAYPSTIRAGDLLLLVDIFEDRFPDIAVVSETNDPVGVQRTLMSDDIGGSSGQISVRSWIATGAETGNIVMTTASAEDSTHHFYCVYDWASDDLSNNIDANPEFPSLATSGNTGQPTFAGINPTGWGTEPSLYFIISAKEQNEDITVSPVDYEITNSKSTGLIENLTLTTGFKFANVAAESPGTLNYTGSTAPWVTTMVAVRGANPATIYAVPLKGSIVLAGLAPTVAIKKILFPGVGAIVLTGRAPTIPTAGNTVNPGVGAITLTGRAPTLVRTAHVIKIPGVGAIALAGKAPSLAFTARPNIGAIALLGRTPTLSQTFNQFRIPGVGAIALTGRAPTLAQTLNQIRIPGLGAIALTGRAPTTAVNFFRTLNIGAITLTGRAPTVLITANTTVTPNVGAITLTGRAPTAVRTQNVFRTPNVGAIALTGKAPTVSFTANFLRIPGVGAITLTGRAPTLLGAGVLSPSTGAIVLTGRAPSLAFTARPNLGAITLTGRQPTAVRTQNVFRIPGLGAIALTGLAPIAVRTQNVFRIPSVGGITVLGRTPNIAFTANHLRIPGLGSIVVTGRTPSLGKSATPGVGAIALTGRIPVAVKTANQTRVPGVGAIALLGRAPVNVVSHDKITPNLGNITFTGRAPSLGTSNNRNVSFFTVTNITLAGIQPFKLISAVKFASPGKGNIVVAGLAPSLVRSTVRIPSLGAITLTGRQPTAVRTQNVFRTPAAGNINILGRAPTAPFTAHHIIPVNKGNITLTGRNPTPQYPLTAPANYDAKWTVDSRGVVWYVAKNGSKWAVLPRGTSWYNKPRGNLWADPQE